MNWRAQSRSSRSWEPPPWRTSQAAFPDAEVGRVMPNLAVEVSGRRPLRRRGVRPRGSGEAGRSRVCRRVARLAIRRRHCGDGLLPGVFRPGGRGARRGRDRRRPRGGAGREAGRRGCRGHRSADAHSTPSRAPGRSHFAWWQHGSGFGSARARRGEGGIRSRGQGLAGANAGVMLLALDPRRRRRLRRRALPRLHHPDPDRVLMSWIPRMPYNRGLRSVLDFITETTDPYLNLFRRIIPPIGGRRLRARPQPDDRHHRPLHPARARRRPDRRVSAAGAAPGAGPARSASSSSSSTRSPRR